MTENIEWVVCEYSAQTLLATALSYWLDGKEMPPSLGFVISQFVRDLPRWLSALRMSGMDTKYAAKLEIVVLNGVPFEAAELTTLPGIGRKKAIKLYMAGIKSKKDLKDQKALAERLLGPKTFSRAITMLDEGKVILYF